MGELQEPHLPVVGVKVHGVKRGAAGYGGGCQRVLLLPVLSRLHPWPLQGPDIKFSKYRAVPTEDVNDDILSSIQNKVLGPVRVGGGGGGV